MRTEGHARHPVTLLTGDARSILPRLRAGSFQTCVTSPPYYGLRDYGVAGQIGLEQTPDEYVAQIVALLREVRRVLADDGTLWLNLGDSFAGQGGGGRKGNSQREGRGSTTAQTRGASRGAKRKDLLGIPWMVAFGLRDDGWWLRSAIIWAKGSPMPESVTDRPTSAYEHVFLLSKRARYFYDAKAIAEPVVKGSCGSRFDTGKTGVNGAGRVKPGVRVEGDTRNARDVWHINAQPCAEAHFATMPPELARRCILAGSRPGDAVLDPFNGAGTSGLVAWELGRHYTGVDLNPDYISITERRLATRLYGA